MTEEPVRIPVTSRESMSLIEFYALAIAMMLLVLLGVWLFVLFAPKPGQHRWRNLGTVATLLLTITVALSVYVIVALWTSPFASQLASSGTARSNLGYLFPAAGIYVLLFFIFHLRRARRNAARTGVE
jgi:cytochrome bd-type quinol oxidase subunit 2